MSGRAGARRGTPEAWFTFVVLALCVVAVVTMYARGGRTSVGVVVAAGLPFVLLVAIAAALLPWWHHPRWRLALVGALLLSQAPLLDHVVPDRAPAPTGSQTIRVATLNTLHSRPTDAALVELAQDVDVLALQEWSASRTRGLTAALGPDWQLVASDNDDYIAAQVAVWVRRSWTVLEAPHLPGRQPGRAVRLERDGTEVTVIGTRLQNPAFFAADLWGAGLDSLRLASAGSTGHVIVMGDLNAPPSAVAFRRFARQSGLRDCTAQLGMGFPGTWGRTPGSAVAPVPIDHVMTRGAVCTDLEITRRPGSDHAALVATVALP